jgi:hypothetical protein
MLRDVAIERIEPLDDSLVFGDTGPWEWVFGTARGEVDPDHPANRRIALLDAAPRNDRGLVEYATDVHLLRPRDAARGNGRLLLEVCNRGRKLLFSNLGDALAGGNLPRVAAEFGNGFPLRLGYTIAWAGWDPHAPRARDGLAMRAPIATDGGAPIVQRVRETFVSGTRAGVLESFRLSHAAASLAPERARLTLRERHSDRPRELPPAAWEFVDARTVRLADGAVPLPGWIYTLHYDAIDPPGCAMRRRPSRCAGACRPMRWRWAFRRPDASCAISSGAASTATSRAGGSSTARWCTSPGRAGCFSILLSRRPAARSRSTRTTTFRRTTFRSPPPASPIRSPAAGMPCWAAMPTRC